MNSIVNIGPLALNVFIICLAMAYFLAVTLAHRVFVALQVDINWIRNTIDSAFLAGFVGAKLGFVAQFWPAYVDKPWEALYFWQSGYSIVFGIAAGTLYSLYRMWRSYQISIAESLEAARLTLKQQFAGLGAYFGLFITLFALSFFVISGLVGDNGIQQEASKQVIQEISAAKFQTINGQPVSLEDLKGQPVLVNFWATWCGPCRREMALLNRTSSEYESQGIWVVALNMSERFDLVQSFIDDHGLHDLPIWVDGQDRGQDLFDQIGGQVLPTSLFIDAKGEIQQIRTGELSSATIMQGMEAIR